MPSSASTLSRTGEAGVPLFVWIAREDHPRACTGRRLVRQRIVREIGASDALPNRAILLDPMVEEPLGPYDSGRGHSAGVVAVDCSWNRLSNRGNYPRGAVVLDQLRYRRRLPWLMATNPQHFGRVGELTTAEALGASLWLLGEPRAAEDLLRTFAGGTSFFQANESRLRAYQTARSPSDLLGLEARQF